MCELCVEINEFNDELVGLGLQKFSGSGPSWKMLAMRKDLEPRAKSEGLDVIWRW